MRVVFDENGYVKHWVLKDDGGRIPDKNEQVIQTPEDLNVQDFIKKFKHYHMVDGKLIKDESHESESNNTQTKELTLQEKMKLFVEALEVDEQPEYQKGEEYKPYFDKKNMRFSWRRK